MTNSHKPPTANFTAPRFGGGPISLSSDARAVRTALLASALAARLREVVALMRADIAVGSVCGGITRLAILQQCDDVLKHTTATTAPGGPSR